MTKQRLPPALEFLQQVWHLNHAMERLSSQMERTLGVTGQQRLVIRCIGWQPGLLASELARLLHLDRGTVSATLKRLENKGLIVRKGDPRDGRQVRLRLTRRGSALDVPRAGTAEHAVAAMLETKGAKPLSVARKVLEALATQVIAEAQDRQAFRPSGPGKRPRRNPPGRSLT